MRCVARAISFDQSDWSLDCHTCKISLHRHNASNFSKVSILTKIAMPGKQKSLQLTCRFVTLKGGEDSLLSERLGFNFEVLLRLLPFVDFILSLIIILRSYQLCCVLLY